MYLRKLRSFLPGADFVVNMKHYSHNTTRSVIGLIAKYLGIRKQPTMWLTARVNLERVKYDELTQVLKTFDRLELNRRDVMRYPGVLTKSFRVVELRASFLKETGFKEVKILHLAKFKACVLKKIRILKALGYIPDHLNVPETLIASLHPKPVDFNPGKFTDEDTLMQVHAVIIKNYLMWRLEASRDEIETLYSINPAISTRSFRHICENIENSLELGFPPRKLLRHGYVLVAYPDYTRTLLEKFSNIAGADLRAAMSFYPKLMTIPPLNFHKMYKMLQAFGINDSMIRNHMNIFTLSLSTVRHRLSELKNIPELNVFRSNPHILQIIYHHNRTRSRLSFLQQLQMRCASLMVLGKAVRVFEEKLREGKDTYRVSDIMNLLTYLLDCDKDSIKKSIKRHPYYLQVPLVDIERNIHYLKIRYTKESIIEVLPVVLYPSDKLEAALKKAASTGLTKLSDTKTLNLALYYMEKEHHFTGNGVW